ncbi:unnamed protein product, partial [Urochloa humidicola]
GGVTGREDANGGRRRRTHGRAALLRGSHQTHIHDSSKLLGRQHIEAHLVDVRRRPPATSRCSNILFLLAL